MMAGLSLMVTRDQRLSNLLLSLWMKRGCWVSAMRLSAELSDPGTHPSKAMSWQPLQTPKLHVSLLHAKSFALTLPLKAVLL